jgi:transcriptional regulator with XRE-family HTH domain
MMQNIVVYENIRKTRVLKKISRKYIAYHLKMSLGNYGKIERGQIDVKLDTLILISSILKVNINELIDFDFNKYVNKKNNYI